MRIQAVSGLPPLLTTGSKGLASPATAQTRARARVDCVWPCASLPEARRAAADSDETVRVNGLGYLEEAGDVGAEHQVTG